MERETVSSDRSSVYLCNFPLKQCYRNFTYLKSYNGFKALKRFLNHFNPYDFVFKEYVDQPCAYV